MRAATLTAADARAIVRLLGEVCAIRTGRPTQIRHLMGGLTRLVNAETWVWGLGTSLGPGELPTWLIRLHGGFDDERFAKFMRAQEHPDMTRLTAPFTALLMEKKTHITRLRQQTDPEDRLRESGAFELWRDANLAPGILSARPLDERTVSVMSLYRGVDAPTFTERESRIAHILLTEVPWLHAGVDGQENADSVSALSPRRRTILNLLLDGQPRREIAAHLGVSIHTANEHVKEIYHVFSVHSQAELIRRFSHGDGGDGG